MAMPTPSDDDAIFNLSHMTFILAFWFVGHDDATPPEDRTDWMAAAFRTEAGGPWTLRQRVRFHSSPDPFDAGDVKRAHEVQLPTEIEERDVLRLLDEAAHEVSRHNHCPVDRVLVRGGAEKAVRLLLRKSWAHARPGERRRGGV